MNGYLLLMPAPVVVVVTDIPSPYQVELFNEITRQAKLCPRLVFVRRNDPERSWLLPSIEPEHVFLDRPADCLTANEWVHSGSFVVFSHYSDERTRQWIRGRAASGRPWCYWGERPGARGWGWLGSLYRRWKLAPLHRAPVPIWGIGTWAVQGWQREFGGGRRYANVPYFSDLARFAPPAPRPARPGLRRFLFSGSLIARKGVDLLAEAFVRLARERPDIRLDFVGTSELEPRLRARLASCPHQVRFLGFCAWPDLPACYHQADVLCAPSRYDGWGLVVPEGLAAGLPVIATDRMGAALELIEPGRNGWLVPAGDLRPLEETLRQAADRTDDQLDALSEAARATASRHSLAQGAQRFSSAALAALATWSSPCGSCTSSPG
jgi:glycosyltransferase involved in cell wall biosynthesis